MKLDEARQSVQQSLDDARHGAEVVICDIDAVRTLLDAYEVTASVAWVPVNEHTPMEGEVVEITRMPKVDRARYAPSRNQFFPWSLIDWPTQGIAEGTYSRLREAVTHWRRGPEPGASRTKEDGK